MFFEGTFCHSLVVLIPLVIVCKMLGKINVSLSFLWLVGNLGYLFRFIQDFSLRQLSLRWTLLGQPLSVIIKRCLPNRESKKKGLEKQGLGVSHRGVLDKKELTILSTSRAPVCHPWTSPNKKILLPKIVSFVNIP